MKGQDYIEECGLLGIAASDERQFLIKIGKITRSLKIAGEKETQEEVQQTINESEIDLSGVFRGVKWLYRAIFTSTRTVFIV